MHVLYDARLLHRSLSGLERVQRNLLRELARRPEVERITALVRRGEPLAHPVPEDVETVAVASSDDILRLLLARDPTRRPDVYHLTYFPDRDPHDVWLPVAAPSSVVSVHDAILNRHPEYHEREEGWAWYHRFTRALVAGADRVLCHTRSSSGEAVRDLGADPERIDVAPLAVDPLLLEPVGDDELRRRRERLEVAGRYFVAVGKDYPHKDHRTLFEALALLDADVCVVVAGSRVFDRPAPGFEPIARVQERLGLGDRVRWLEGLDDVDVRALLAGSRGLVFPSLEEGFGLPPLEAMALGVPVAASRAMSIPEVVGDGAWLFEPGDAEGLAEVMRRLLAGGDEVEALRERGRRRAGEFSWARTAEAVVACYRRAIEEGRRRSRSGVTPRVQVRELLAVAAGCPYGSGDELAAWKERCRHAERYAWSLEDQRRELLEQIEAGRKDIEVLRLRVANLERERDELARRSEGSATAAPRPDAGAVSQAGEGSGRFSLGRRLKKVRSRFAAGGRAPAP